jgi:hypothetical protein
VRPRGPNYIVVVVGHLDLGKACRERARPLPGAPNIDVSNLAPTNKFICVFQAPDGVCGGHKIYIGSGRTSLHPVIDGLRYWHH